MPTEPARHEPAGPSGHQQSVDHVIAWVTERNRLDPDACPLSFSPHDLLVAASDFGYWRPIEVRRTMALGLAMTMLSGGHAIVDHIDTGDRIVAAKRAGQSLQELIDSFRNVGMSADDDTGTLRFALTPVESTTDTRP